MDPDDGVVASAIEVTEIAEVARLLAHGGRGPFSEAEWAYSQSKRDPERRLATRLAAKRAAASLLQGGVEPADIEILPSRGGPPGIALAARARERLAVLGAARVLVSLTHGVGHAAASVLLLRDRE